MARGASIVFALIGCVSLGATVASAHPFPMYRHTHYRHAHYRRAQVGSLPVVPEGYAYGGYERGFGPEYAPGYGPGYAPGAGYFIAPRLGLDGPGFGYNGY